MRRVGLEWLFRLLQEPRRLARRYLLGNPSFLLLAVLNALSNRREDEPRSEDKIVDLPGDTSRERE